MRKYLISAAFASLLISCQGQSSAEETMTVSSWAPPTHLVNAKIWPQFIRMVEEATEGRVKGKIEYGLAPPPSQIDLIEDGAADVTWIFHGYTPGRFVTTQLIELPGTQGNAEAASVAHWRAFGQYLKQASEHEGVRVVALMTHGPGQLHTTDPVKSLADVKGKKIRIGGGVSAEVGNALGVVGVQVPAPKVYETVAGGVADGVMMPNETIKSFRLIEVAPNTLSMPGGFYRGSFAIIMSPDFLDRLPEQDREAIMNLDGEEISAMAGRAWDEADEAGTQTILEQGTLTTASDADQQAFKAMIGPIREAVVAQTKERGVDAEAALNLIQESMASYGQ